MNSKLIPIKWIASIGVFSIALLSLSGCAATYSPPVSLDQNAVYKINGNKITMLKATKQALIMDGFQITNSDDEAGVISTAQKDMRLNPMLADCGTTMGLDYLKDNRTSTKVGYGVVINDDKIAIKTNISATYLLSNVEQSITLSCVSRGVLEEALYRKIVSK